MDEKFQQYAERQKKFWDTPTEHEALFGRVDLYSDGSEEKARDYARKRADLVFQDVQAQPGWTLLELGCGVGAVMHQVKERIPFQKFHGVDISAKMIDYTRARLGDDPRISLHVNSGFDLSMIGESSLDFCYSVDVFIHIYDVDIVRNYFREIRRILKPKGLFRFNVRRFDPWENFGNTPGGIVAKLAYATGLRSTGLHQWNANEAAEFNGNLYTEKELRNIVRDAGLTPLNMRRVQWEKDDHLWVTARRD